MMTHAALPGLALLLALTSGMALTACDASDEAPPGAATDDHGHSHGAEDDHGHSHGADDDHDHAEVPLGAITIGDLEVQLTQGHGAVEPGKESHLVVKLPYTDDGSTVVRAWIGTADQLQSYVGKGEYSGSNDAYDVHATAPEPLPESPMWWIELERPDGTKLTGSATPSFE